MIIIKIRVPKNLIIVFLALLVWMPPLHTPVQVRLLLTGAYTVFVLLLWNTPLLLKDRYIQIFLAYGMVMLFSEATYEKDMFGCALVLMYILVVVTIWATMLKYVNSRKFFQNALLLCIMFYLLLDFYFAFLTVNGSGRTPTGQPLYFSGDKFQTCYVYIVFLTLLFLRPGTRKIAQILAILFGIFYAFYVDCNTGAIAILTYGMIVLALPRFLLQKSRIYWLLGCLIALNYVILFLQIQTVFPFLTYLIQVVLSRDITMSGRFRIYSHIPEIMAGHWVFGFGYTSMSVGRFTGYGNQLGSINMQNGLLQILYTNGLVGFGLYVLLMLIVFVRLNSIKNSQTKLVLTAALSAFLIAAIVEIPFDYGAYHIIIGLILLESRDAHCFEHGWTLRFKKLFSFKET